jgi:uncharacterized protein YegP (UPF0339 family)
MGFELYHDAANELRWRAVAANGQVVGGPGEGYEHRADCVNGAIATAEIVLASIETTEALRVIDRYLETIGQQRITHEMAERLTELETGSEPGT